MGEKPLIYLASPYTRGSKFLNAMAHLAEYITLLEDGIVNPIAPLLNSLLPGADDIPYARWLDLDEGIIERCDAVFAFDAHLLEYDCTESNGRDREVEFAEQLGIPVFRDRAKLYEWQRQRLADKIRIGYIQRREDLK